MSRASVFTLLLVLGCDGLVGDGSDPEGPLGKADDLVGECVPLADDPSMCQRGDQLFRDVVSDDGLVARIPPDVTRPQPRDIVPTFDPVHWQMTQFQPGTYLTGVCMMNDRVGYAVGDIDGIKGVIYRTIDGGDTWKVAISSASMTWPYGCEAVSETGVVVVVGFSASATDNGGMIMWSRDAGKTWTEAERIVTPDGSRPWLDNVEFGTSSHGLITSLDNVAFRTDTGGAQQSDWHQVVPGQSWWSNFTFLPDGRIWLGGVGIVYSSDFGQTWSSLSRASPVFDGAIAISGAGIGYTGSGMIGPELKGWIYRTFDGGINWTPQPVLETEFPIRAIRNFAGLGAIAAGGNNGQGGGIWTTDDLGSTWTQEVATTQEMFDIDIVIAPSGGRAYVVGGNEIWVRDIAP